MKSPAPTPFRIAPVSVALAFTFAPAAFAADGTWTGGPAATWDASPTNWSGVAGTPWDATEGANNRAVFNTAGATPVVSGTVFSNGLDISQTAAISGGSISLVGPTPVVNVTANATISSILTGVGSVLTKTGAGTLALTGANDYTGGTTISGGVVSVGNLTNSGASHLGDGSFTLDGGTLKYTGPAMGTSPGWTRSYTLGSNGGTFDLSSATGTLWIGGTVTYSGSGPRTLTILTSDIPSVSPDGRLGSHLGDGTGGATSLVKNGAGTLIVSGTNTYTGQLQINQGTVQYGNVGAGGESSGVGHSVAIASGANLTFRHGASDAIIYGAPISGAGSVTNNGNGTTSLLTLAGANTYTGTTTLSNGTLAVGVNSVGSVGSITSSAIGRGTLTFNGGALSSNGTTARTLLNPVTFSNTATLGNSTNNGKLNFSANATLGTAVRTLTVASDVQFDGVISGAGGGITKTGSGTLILANSANTYTGVTTIAGGVLSTGVLANSSTASGIGQASSAAANLVLDGGTLKYTGAAVATWNRPFTIGANGATFDLSSANGSLNIAGTTVEYSGTGARSLTITTGASGGRLISALADGTGGATSLVKNGSGTLIISGSNTYNGQLQVLQGTAQLGNAGLGGESTGAGHSVAISNGATLTFRHASNSTVVFNAPISGEGRVNFNYNNNGTVGGSLTLGGNNTFSGGLTINPTSGTNTLPLKAGSTTALGSGTVSIGQYGTLDLNGFNNTTGLLTSTNNAASVTNQGASNATLTLSAASGSQTFGGTLSDGTTHTLALTKSGAGTQILTGANTYSGGTSVEGGTLLINNTTGSGTGSGPVNVSSGGTLGGTGAISGTTTINGGTLNGTLSLTTLIATGNSTIASSVSASGGTTVQSGGVLAVNGSLGGGAININSGATLKGDGTVSGATTINGTLAPGSSPGGLTFSSSLTLAGATTMEIEGTVRGVGGSYDAVDVSGLLTYGGTLTMSFAVNPTSAGTTYDLFSILGGSTGDFSAVSIGGTYSTTPMSNNSGIWTGDDLVNLLTFTFDQASGDLSVSTYSPIPEPAAGALLAGAALLGLVFTKRRRTVR